MAEKKFEITELEDRIAPSLFGAAVSNEAQDGGIGDRVSNLAQRFGKDFGQRVSELAKTGQ